MAEQDRYGGWFGGKTAPLDKAEDNIRQAASDVNSAMPRTSGAEQDVHGSHFSPGLGNLTEGWRGTGGPRGSGAEQDIHGSHFSPGLGKLTDGWRGTSTPQGTGAEQDIHRSHFSPRPGEHTYNPLGTAGVGLLQSAVLPSFTLHAGFSAVAYGVARYTDRVEGKDWLWPAAMTANAWWSAVGNRVVQDGVPLSTAWSHLNYSQRLLLTGVSAWGARLLYRVATRSVKRGGDDPRYRAAKKDPGFWNKALFTMFLPEAALQTIISLPFTLPFRAATESAVASPVFSGVSSLHGVAIFLFSAGFALETTADAQLKAHKKSVAGSSVCRDGVWSIVRHPNYLGDALIHASFPVLLASAGLLHPWAIAGTVANYVFLRYIGGDSENEASQEERYAKEEPFKKLEFDEYRREKNSFWPGLAELQNGWFWAVGAAGVAGVLIEQGVRAIV